MDGILYLWLLWAIWIYTTFMMNKEHPKRLPYSFMCLVLLITYPYGVQIGQMEVALPVIIVGLICIHYFRYLSLRAKLYMLLAILSTGMLYAGIGLVAIYDPVIMFIDQNLIIAFSIVLLIYIFYSSSSYLLRITSITGSSIVGEIFMGIPLNNVGLSYPIGGPQSLDVLAISIGVLMIIKWLGEINLLFNKAQISKGEMKNL
ncbi:hypothetical protein LCL98_07105 [Rossellomorea aquimaris]|nr:hypothetical protein [Rossellomorea aquimaris]